MLVLFLLILLALSFGWVLPATLLAVTFIFVAGFKFAQ